MGNKPNRFDPPDRIRVDILAPDHPDYDPDYPYRTVEPLTYTNTVVSVTVPVGTKLDGASVPRLLHPIFPPVGHKVERATAIHDALYYSGATDRAVADGVFKSVMQYDGVSPWRMWAMYLAVRLFGWMPWNDRRAHEDS